MMIYPAVDIKDGKCVRLTQGKFTELTVFGEDPVAAALKWQSAGAKYLHIVDLDGAKNGDHGNRAIIKEIARQVNIPIQTGGGIRTLTDLEELFSAGIARAILGTSAVRDQRMLQEAAAEYGDRVAVGIDAKNGLVAVSGWEEVSSLSAYDFAKDVEKLGVKHIIFTDIATDGMLKGPNLAAMEQMRRTVPSLDLIASGGVSAARDVADLLRTGVDGVIIGKALYTGKIDLAEALQTVSTQPGGANDR